MNPQIQAGHLETVHSSQWFLQGTDTANAFQKPNWEMELGPKLRGKASSLPIFSLERNKALWATDRQALKAFLQLPWMQGFSRGSQHFCLIQRPQAPDKSAGWGRLQSMKAGKKHQALVRQLVQALFAGQNVNYFEHYSGRNWSFNCRAQFGLMRGQEEPRQLTQWK